MLGPRGAAEFQAALILDTTRKVSKLTTNTARWLFLAGTTIVDIPSRSRWTVAQQRGGDLSERVGRAFRKMLRRHRAAVIIGTDSPLLAPRVLGQALAELRVCDAVLGPCPDGGFYLIGLRRIVPGIFRGVRWSTRFAFRDMLRRLLRIGFACSVLASVPDVDRPRDFLDLSDQMVRNPAIRAMAPASWRFLSTAEKNWK